MGLLTGKTALITGAARGIGKAIALRFAEEGANIAFTDLVIDENGKATEAEIAAKGVKAKGYASNAADFAQTAEVVNQVKEDFGSIDILVNNAGITKDGLMMRMTEAQWDAVIAVNLKSAFNFIHACTPIMMRQKSGSIINMSLSRASALDVFAKTTSPHTGRSSLCVTPRKTLTTSARNGYRRYPCAVQVRLKTLRMSQYSWLQTCLRMLRDKSSRLTAA